MKKYFGDLRDDKYLKKIPNQDIILHLSGTTHSKSYDDYYHGNVLATKNLINHFKNRGVKKFIYVSTRCAKMEAGSYGTTKLIAENLIKESGINYLILRVSEVFGKNQSSFNFVNKLLYFSPIILLPYWKNIYLQPILIEDLVQLLNKILSSHHNNKTYTVAGSEIFNLKDLIKIIPGFLNKYRLIIPIPILIIKVFSHLNLILKRPYFYPDQIPRLICKKPTDISSIEKDFNFKPESVRKFIKELEDEAFF